MNILRDHLQIDPTELKGVLINSKGFGGNNASALVLSPHQTMQMLTQRYGQAAVSAYWEKNKPIAEQQATADALACQGTERIIYKFGKSVMDADSISFSTESMRLSEFEHPIDLPTVNPYDAYQS